MRINSLTQSGKVAILDGSHTTASRRQLVLSRCQAENFRVLFVQTDITDPGAIYCIDVSVFRALSHCASTGIQEQNIAETVHCSPEYLLSSTVI